MSFSSQVKEELEKVIPSSRHCRLAEYQAFAIFGYERKYFTLWKKNIMINECVDKVVQNPLILKQNCCKRAFLRGAFLCVGSMSDPNKAYHLEFVCETEEQAEMLQELIAHFDLETKIICRKNHYVVYMKEGSAIVDLLNVIGARISLMNLENLRVEKEVRNFVNRKVNCEAANISKTVHAANKQIEDIIYIQKHYGMQNLPEQLREMAEVRLEHPESSLQELGRYLNPPVGKSGVNHRLRKLSELAERIKV